MDPGFAQCFSFSHFYKSLAKGRAREVYEACFMMRPDKPQRELSRLHKAGAVQTCPQMGKKID